VVSKVRQRLSVSKQAVLKFDVERFNLQKLNDVELKAVYKIKDSALENMDYNDDC
jgi:hypothetical protein